jgi:hypothetical protein
MRGLIKKISVLILISIPYFAHSQSFLGPHLSQYDPLKAVYFNPASLPNSDMRWQVNILSADVSVGNDFLRLASLKGIFKKEFDPYHFFEVNMNGQDKNMYIESDIRGPGFMINLAEILLLLGQELKKSLVSMILMKILHILYFITIMIFFHTCLHLKTNMRLPL